jgi:hypothetical protein
MDRRHLRERHPRPRGFCPVDRRHRAAVASQASRSLRRPVGRSSRIRVATAARRPSRRCLAWGSSGTRLAVAAWRTHRRVDRPARLGAATERPSATSCATVSMGPTAQRRPVAAGLARQPSASTGPARKRGGFPASECPWVGRSGQPRGRHPASAARPVRLASTERQAAEPTELSLSQLVASGPRPPR